MNDLALHSPPFRPQFGNLQLSCAARTPSKNMIATAVVLVVFFVAATALAAIDRGVATWVMKSSGFTDAMKVGSLIGLGLANIAVLMVGYRLGRRLIDSGYSETVLSVYESGLHVAYVVHYRINYGQLIQFCSGVREVSRSFNRLKSVDVTEIKQKGQSFMQAEIEFSDGDKVRIHTADEGDTISAIRSIVTAAGDKATVK